MEMNDLDRCQDGIAVTIRKHLITKRALRLVPCVFFPTRPPADALPTKDVPTIRRYWLLETILTDRTTVWFDYDRNFLTLNTKYKNNHLE